MTGFQIPTSKETEQFFTDLPFLVQGIRRWPEPEPEPTGFYMGHFRFYLRIEKEAEAPKQRSRGLRGWLRR